MRGEKGECPACRKYRVLHLPTPHQPDLFKPDEDVWRCSDCMARMAEKQREVAGKQS